MTRRAPAAVATAALAATLATALCAAALVPAAAAPGTTGVAGRTAPAANAIDTGSRSAVADAWRSRWLPAAHQQVSLSGGSAQHCKPFTASAATQARALSAINFVRGLDGLDSISSVVDGYLDQSARSALIQAANNTLTHVPSTSMRCYTKAGAYAAYRSDLGYLTNTDTTWMPTVADFVRIFMREAGADNRVVGHRRWILRPQAGAMANAYALAAGGLGRVVTNDLYVFPASTDRPHATRPAFYAWPAAGYFPTALEPGGRWSLSASSQNVHFTHARVSVTYHGQPVKITRYAAAEHYADNALVWQFATPPPRVTGSRERDYAVTVSHITGAKAYHYTVRLFAP